MTTLTFQNTTLSVINQNNQTFLTSSDLGSALQYANPLQAINKLYNSNADEFTAEMTALIEMPTAGGLQKVRIFSLRGAHLIAMFARTKVAKDFRKWVLDILDREILQNANQIQPLVERKYTFEFTEYELQQLAWLWFAFKRGVGTFQYIEKAFKTLGSNMSGQIYGQAYEYLSVLRSTNKILNRITQEFEIDPMTNWRALEHLRHFDPKAVKIDF
ncbi:TPA: P22AR C-terminal domain-containing protein [Haemophilus influenzae]